MLEQVKNNLKSALANNEMYLVYQPIFNVEQYIIGYEVLARWESKALGSVEPILFMSAFEELDLVSDLNNWFFNNLLEDMQEVGALKVRKLFINMSFKQLCDESLPNNIERLTELIELDQIVFEVTEATLMSEMAQMINIMEDFAKRGASFALDDFGTGYSSMKYLKILPLSYIKIDKEFVSEIDVNHSDMAIVKATLEMSRAMGFDVIAEGVENQSQFVLLKSMGIKYVQGYLFNHPTDKNELSF